MAGGLKWGSRPVSVPVNDLLTDGKLVVPERWFRCARAFEFAARYLNVVRANTSYRGMPYWGLVFPHFVLAAFALELYLKALLHLTKHRAPRTHSPVDLFSTLERSDRDRLTALYDGLVVESPASMAYEAFTRHLGSPRRLTVDSVLAGADRAFTAYRYLYERGPADFAGVEPLKVVLDWYIIGLKPEWGPGIQAPWRQLGTSVTASHWGVHGC